MKLLEHIPLVTLFSCFFFEISIGQNMFKNDLTYGKHPVGFKNVDVADYSRPSFLRNNDKTSFREMNISVWYPAKYSSKSKLKYRDYVNLALPKSESKIQNKQSKKLIETVSELSGDTTLFEPKINSLLSSEMISYHNAVVVEGNFPMLFFPDRPHVQNIMCEYLASHGYIVVSPMLKGNDSPAMEYTAKGIETAVQDLQFALGYVRKNFKTNNSFAVMGLGFNATNALAWQMRNADIQAFISLEGGITTGFEEQLIQKSPFFDIKNCTADMLIIHAPHPDVKPELTYKYKYANRIYQSYNQSSEFYFLNFGIWEKNLSNIFPKANKGNTWKSFEHAALSIKLFLDDKLKTKNPTAILGKLPNNNLTKTTFQKAELFNTREEKTSNVNEKDSLTTAENSYYAPLVDSILNKSKYYFKIINKTEFAIYYPNTPFFIQNIKSLNEEASKAYKLCNSLLKNSNNIPKLKIIYFENREQLRPFLNFAPKGIALPDAYTLLIATNDSTRVYHTHEMMHIFSYHLFGGNAAHPTDWIQEGLSVYADSPCKNEPLHKIAAYLIHKDKYIALQKLTNDFRTLPDMQAYMQAGSFCQYLISEYGLQKFKLLWEKGVGSFIEVLGKSNTEIEDEYIKFVKLTYPVCPSLNWADLEKNGCG